jgi:hypothetical protein
MTQSGYLVFADARDEVVKAADLTVALAICRTKRPNARIAGLTDAIGVRILDEAGTVAYYLGPEDWERMKRYWKDYSASLEIP